MVIVDPKGGGGYSEFCLLYRLGLFFFGRGGGGEEGARGGGSG